MQEEHEKRILDELKLQIHKDINLGLKNLANKSRLDIKSKLFDLLNTDDGEELKHAQKFLQDSTDVIVEDLQSHLKEVLEKY